MEGQINKERRWWSLAILNVLMNADDYLTTSQIIDKVGCDRKTVYHAIPLLEVNGFGIEVIESKGRYRDQNKYKYIGLYGLG